MKKGIVIFIIIFVLFNYFSSYADQPTKTIQQLLEESKAIRNVLIDEDYKRLLQLSDAILKQDLKNIEALDNKIHALIGLRQFKEVIKVYDAAIKISPKNLLLHIGKADAYMQLKQYSNAIKCYDKALATNAPDIKSWYCMIYGQKAIAYHALKKYNDEITCYEKQIANSGYFYGAELGIKRGLAYMSLKQYRNASKVFAEAKRHIPLNYANAYKDLAQVYYYNACAYKSVNKISQAIAELSVAFKYDRGLKVNARKDSYFKSLAKNKEFLNLLNFDAVLLNALHYQEGYYVVDHVVSDINGDKCSEDVVLVGRDCSKDGKNCNLENPVLIIKDKNGYKEIKLPFSTANIFEDVKNYLFLYDLNGDKIKDVFIEVGGSPNSQYAAFSFIGNKPNMIFGNDMLSDGFDFTTELLDVSNILVKCLDSDKSVIINVPNIGTIPNPQNIKGTIGAAWDIVPFDVDGDQVFELKINQVIGGYGSRYEFGNLISTLNFNQEKSIWEMASLEFKKH